MAAGLRQITPREQSIVNKWSAQHGQVRGFEAPIADDTGGIGMPLLRVPLLARLEHRGTIGRSEAEAGERFHAIFRIATLDTLRAADMARTPVSGGRAADISPSAERCRRRVTEAMAALGGAGSPAAGAVWGICGEEKSVREWALATGRRQEVALGILVAGLGVLSSHFAGRRQRRA